MWELADTFHFHFFSCILRSNAQVNSHIWKEKQSDGWRIDGNQHFWNTCRNAEMCCHGRLRVEAKWLDCTAGRGANKAPRQRLELIADFALRVHRGKFSAIRGWRIILNMLSAMATIQVSNSRLVFSNWLWAKLIRDLICSVSADTRRLCIIFRKNVVTTLNVRRKSHKVYMTQDAVSLKQRRPLLSWKLLPFHEITKTD